MASPGPACHRPSPRRSVWLHLDHIYGCSRWVMLSPPRAREIQQGQREATTASFTVSLSGLPISTSSAIRVGTRTGTYGEDPFLTSKWVWHSLPESRATIRYPKAVATSKHFAVHSGPESLRHGFNVDVSRATWKKPTCRHFDPRGRWPREVGDVRLQRDQWDGSLRQQDVVEGSPARCMAVQGLRGLRLWRHCGRL